MPGCAFVRLSVTRRRQAVRSRCANGVLDGSRSAFDAQNLRHVEGVANELRVARNRETLAATGYSAKPHERNVSRFLRTRATISNDCKRRAWSKP